MNLNFLSPFFLLGALGISVPILIHLLTRRQQKHISFSAVYLLQQTQKRSIRKSKPNRLVLLLIRCLGIILLSLSLASPIVSMGAPEDFISDMPSATVFIMDDSLSMGTQSEDETLFDDAVEKLTRLLKKMPGESAYSIVSASSPGRILLDWTTSTETGEKLLRGSKPSFRTTSIGRAIAEALNLLESASQKDKRIYILTDRDKNGWNQEEFPELNSRPPIQVNIIDFSNNQKKPNQAAVKEVTVRQEFLTNSKIIRVKAKVLNLSSNKSIPLLGVSLWVGGQKKSEGTLRLEPNSEGEKEFSFPYFGNETIEGIIQIQDDGQLLDNERYFSYQPDRVVRVLVVDGDPRTIEHQSESFYLERALNPFTSSTSNIEPTVSTLSELSSRSLFDYSVVILCNVRDLPIDYELKLEKFVFQGGALIISLGDQVDAKFYNEKLGGLLPVTLKSRMESKNKEEVFRFLPATGYHRVINIFSEKSLHEMQAIQFTTVFSTDPMEGRSFTVPMWFTGHIPAVIEFQKEKGKVILFTSSIDRDWNNFPIQPTFLPWIQRWVKYSAHSLESIRRQDIFVGDPFTWTDPSTEETVYIHTPGNNFVSKKSTDKGFQYTDTEQPGVYRLYRSPGKTADNIEILASSSAVTKIPENAKPAGTFTVNFDTKESITGKISDEEILSLLDKIPVQFSTAKEPETSENFSKGIPLATPFLFLMACMLFAEGWLVRKE